MQADEPIPFGIVGTGWRSQFYLRVAQACSDRFSVVGIVGRNREKRDALAARFGVDHYDSVGHLAPKVGSVSL